MTIESKTTKKCCSISNNTCENKAFINSDTYEKCVYYAFYDENGMKHSHQYRIPKNVLDTYMKKLLLLENEFNSCKDFDEVYELFKKHRIHGIGNLTIYDVSLSVSQNYGIYPDYVYLHAGTKAGALNAGLIKRYNRMDKLSFNDITKKFKWFEKIKPYQIEDFLCIYKENICEKNLNEFLNK